MIWLALFFMQAGEQVDAARGAAVFAQSCAVGYCHGTAGAANRGPRLSGRGLDRAYLDKVTREGIPNTAMPGFQKVLSAPDLSAVIAYVASISGSGAAAAAPVPAHLPEAAPAPFPGPPEARRGKSLFFDATRGTRCGTCHAVQDWGAAVGPNLAAKPPANAAAIRNAPATHVQTAISVSERFPALVVAQTRDLVRLYDLTSPPPVLRTFATKDVRLTSGAPWKHASAVSGYSDEELSSIADYLAWLAQRK
jgi:mono/diheme cytochrome c family protein